MSDVSLFKSFIQCKCPQCREGKMFVYPPISTKFSVMYEDCPVCGLHYEIETGFFWGSMYVNYGLTMAIVLPLILLTYNFMDNPDVWVYMSVLIPVLLILSPIVFRFGRVIMLYAFGSIKYKRDLVKELKQ